MHKSVADWLRDCERKGMYVIDEEDIGTAHRRMVICEKTHKKKGKKGTRYLPFVLKV